MVLKAVMISFRCGAWNSRRCDRILPRYPGSSTGRQLRDTGAVGNAGYDSDVIMAAGAFVQGSSIELSADGPIKPPYAVYFQGGLTWQHAKLGILMSLQKLYDADLVRLPL